MGNDVVPERRLDVEPGRVVELSSVQEFASFLERDAVMYHWWRVKMGYKES
jgi:hypothetical protein